MAQGGVAGAAPPGAPAQQPAACSKSGDPEKVMRDLMQERYPIYAEADITVESRDVPHELIVVDTVGGARRWLERGKGRRRQRAVVKVNDARRTGRIGARDRRDHVRVEFGDRSYDIVIGKDCSRARRADRRGAARRPLRRGQRRQRRRALSWRRLKVELRRRLFLGESWLRRASIARASPCSPRSASDCSRSALSAATPSSRLAAAWSATLPALPQASFAAASASCRSRRPCSRRSIPPSAARPASTRRKAKI